MVIAAHMDETAEVAGASPRPPRRTLRLPAKGSSASGSATAVLIHNISASGLLLEGDLALGDGQAFGIELPHAGEVRATVVWSSDNFFGCRFDAPISTAALSAAQLRSAVPASGERSDVEEAFGPRLQRLRQLRGLTLSQVAEQLGVSKPTVWAWEQGKAKPVQSRLETLAQVLGVPTADLFSGGDDAALRAVLARARHQIASAAGTSPDKIRVMIEL